MATQPHYRRGVVLNLAHFDFDIVSDFDIRISDFILSACPSCPACLRSTLVETPLQIALFLQNKANFKMGNINISIARTKAYAKEQRTMSNERYSKQTQSNPIPPLPESPPARGNKGEKNTFFFKIP
jgi:hypothetical protein